MANGLGEGFLADHATDREADVKKQLWKTLHQVKAKQVHEDDANAMTELPVEMEKLNVFCACRGVLLGDSSSMA